ncbi:BLOC-1-related complex subunit 8 isoform X1 [Aptenodytes patagonicus]|uniref:BLOC-1-related complex subunit 8 isoform X1 n=1 Tax=Aptenodytes patagonicus TaxID=9234 RepID=UPI003FA16353
MEEPEMQLKVKKGAVGVLLANLQGKRDQSCDLAVRTTTRKVTDKFTESMYVLANEPSVALYRLQEHVRRSLPELAQHKSDMQSWEEQSQGAIYTVEYACSAIKNMTDSSVYFKSIDSLLKHAIAMKDQLNAAQGRSTVAPQAKNPPASS